MAKDFYATLGIQRGASADEIKKAYRSLSKQYHPDKHKGDKDIEQKYKEINEAYEVLSDPKKRQMYDQFGSADGPQGFGGGGPGGFDFSGFQGQDFGGFGDIFEQFFGNAGRGRRPREETGRDMEVQISIPFKEAVSGSEHAISIEGLIPCEDCDGKGAEKGSALKTCTQCSGTGQVTRTVQSFFGAVRQSSECGDCKGSGKIPETPCSRCKGEGRIHKKHSVTIEIPAGIHDGQSLRIRGKGEAGRQGTAAGDLYVHVRVEPDRQFDRDGDDVRSILTLSVLDAILGTEATVETVHGKVKLVIPPGTQPDQVFRIRNKGMPVLSSSRHGDHYVIARVEIPTKLSKAEKKLLEEWRAMNS